MTLLATLVILYGVGVVLTLFTSGLAYVLNRDIYDDMARTAAKWFIASPLWPILVIRAFLKLLAQAKDTLKGDDR